MNVTMSVRFCDYFHILHINSNFSRIIYQSWNIFLLHNIDMIFTKSKIVVLFKKSHGSIVSIIRSHNAEWNIKICFLLLWYVRKTSFSAGMNIIGIVFQIAVILFDCAYWKINFNAGISQPFTKTSSNKNKTSFVKFFCTFFFIVVKLFLAWFQEDTCWHFRLILVKSIESLHRFFKKFPTSLKICFHASWCYLVQFYNLLGKPILTCLILTVLHNINKFLLMPTIFQDFNSFL